VFFGFIFGIPPHIAVSVTTLYGSTRSASEASRVETSPLPFGAGLCRNVVEHPSNARTNAGEFLHAPKFFHLLDERCDAVGVSVIADMPAPQIHPAANEPAPWRDFVFRNVERVAAGA
jgi:hypothetical protein